MCTYCWCLQIGGSADLTGSNETRLKGEGVFSSNKKYGSFSERYLHYGVREHAMSAISNGLYAYGCFRPFGAAFLNFITYAWGAVRLSALSEFGILLIATHDSIELGEDGPTHQAVEVIPLCRSLPNMLCIRPAGKRPFQWFLLLLGRRSTAPIQDFSCAPCALVTHKSTLQNYALLSIPGAAFRIQSAASRLKP